MWFMTMFATWTSLLHKDSAKGYSNFCWLCSVRWESGGILRYLGNVICIQWKTWKEVKIQGKYGDSGRYIKAERKIKQIGDLSIMFYRSKRNEQIRKVRKFIGIQKENMPMNPDHGGGQAEWPVQRHTCCESILTLKMMTGSSSTELLYRIKRNYSHKSQQVIVI